MRTVLLLILLFLAACDSKTGSKLHTIRMDAGGSRIYDYRIELGKSVLPGGNRGLKTLQAASSTRPKCRYRRSQ